MPLPTIGPGGQAAIQGGAGFLGSIVNNIFGRKRQKKQFAHDRQMAEYAYGKDLDMWNRQSQWNLDMWNLQNQYNLPENAMQRLRDAGLNPNLVATAGASGGQAANVQPATSPKYQQVRANYDFPPVNVPNVLGMYQNFRLANAQVDQVKANTDLTRQKELTENIETSLRAVKRGLSRQDYTMKSELAKYAGEHARLLMEERRNRINMQLQDEKIKKHMVGRTEAEAGLKGIEYEFFKSLGIKGLKEVAPFLQLLLQSYRRGR